MLKSIPYGVSDFKDVIQNHYYIDRTNFIPLIEQAGRFLYLIRPKRFGKSLFLNMLDFYYNIKYKDEFDLLKGLYIHSNPTKEKNSYHIIKFDFSVVSTTGDVNENFSEYCNDQIKEFIDTYNFDFKLSETKPIHMNLNKLFKYLILAALVGFVSFCTKGGEVTSINNLFFLLHYKFSRS
jgi:hypothetical protein